MTRSCLAVLLVLCSFVNCDAQHTDLLLKGYETGSDSLKELFFREWQQESIKFRANPRRKPTKADVRVDQLVSAVLADSVIPGGKFFIVKDSIPVTLSRNFSSYPKITVHYPAYYFSAFNTDSVLYLTRKYDSVLTVFLSRDYDDALAYLRNERSAYAPLKFLESHIAVALDKRVSSDSPYANELWEWRKNRSYASLAWLLPTQPYISKIRMRNNLSEAYVFVNEFDHQRILHYSYKRGHWQVVDVPNKH